MIADILPEKKRPSGFGVMRVIENMAWIIGPTIGGFVANSSYLALFIIDTVASLITAALVWRFVVETKPEITPGTETESIFKTLSGYFQVLKNKLYLAFILVSMLMLLVYSQTYSTLSVFMRDYRGINPQGYGVLLSGSAVLVIIAQFWTTRRVEKQPPMRMMAFGTFFYMIGFTMFGFIQPLWLFLVAILIITVGEMIVVPTGQALVARFAPADMRGRYMATYGLAWTLPEAIGPSAAGIIMDNYNPNWVWFLGGIILLVAIFGFLLLNRHVPTLAEEAPKSAIPAAD